ncbi:hypothetical protein CXB51_014265 [Gossypium anomalum]|uniref:HAT C-terminal dimerisation domain-containing protein n=1 Tax=Gossypium anomalum TaxID=47600 RepID=A0A8J5YXC7_9ROSI|nr:hypothetical protein CXB51_014265 [Gossypium anomalum]
MAAIEGNEISNAQDTTYERPTPEEVERNRKKTSIVWQELTVVKLADGTKKVQCDCCKIKLAKNKDGNLFLPSQAPRSDSASDIQTWKYDQTKIKKVVSHMIMVHDPHYVKTSRATAKADCWTSYEVEKKRLNGLLKIVDMISITTNIWKSGQKIQYMVLTTHFVDSDWNLQKRLLNFVDVPPPHSGVFVYDTLYKCLQDWGIEGKVYSIFVDNASYNYAVVRMLPLNEKLFHVRCCAHILNLLVHDGLSEIEDVIGNVRESVKQITTSTILRVEEVSSFLALLMKLPTLSQGECNLLISIVVVLDLRNKIKLIFSFRVIYSEKEAPRQIHIVCDSLYELYKEYVDEYAVANVGKGKILSIPITMMGLEYAFSAGGRVIDAYRSSLGTDTESQSE